MYNGGSNGNGKNGNGNKGDSSLPFYDNNGKARMVLGVGPSGEPSIRMLDENGVERLIIGLGDGQPAIAFFNEKREPRFLLHPNLFSFGEDGKGMLEMRSGASGALCVRINGKDGKGGIMFGVLDHNQSVVTLSDKAGTARVGMCINKDGSPALNLAGADGKLDWQPEIALPPKRRRRKAG